MSLRPLRLGRVVALLGGLAAATGGALALGSCGESGVGVDPPDDRLFFPSGLLLDPRVAEGTPARWLFVTNANSDLVYNAATLSAIDLDAFMAAWQGDEIGAIGAAVDEARPCRRNALTPQLIECSEERFLRDAATVHLGSFTTGIAAWDRDPADDALRLFIPVRSEPSIAMVDVSGGLPGGDPLEFSCGEGTNPDERDPRRCSREQRLKYLYNTPGYKELGREPVQVTIFPGNEERPLAYVTHSEVPELALVRLTGLVESEIDDDRRPPSPNDPTIVAINDTLLASEQAFTLGGYGLAQRPCYPGNAPALTMTPEGECGRPLLYASYRRQQSVVRFTVETVRPTEGQRCVYPQQLEDGVEGGVLCEEQLVGLDRFYAGGFDVGNASGSAVFGDLAFSRDGNSLYIVQSNPGALVRVDSSLDERGATRDFPSGIVEVCANPTEMILFDDAPLPEDPGAIEYAAISCYSVGMIFIVDLAAFKVVESLSTGSGPHQMIFDRARGYLYVANSLDATIGVIDVSRARSTRFTEVARLGLQEPYTG